MLLCLSLRSYVSPIKMEPAGLCLYEVMHMGYKLRYIAKPQGNNLAYPHLKNKEIDYEEFEWIRIPIGPGSEV